MFVHLVKALEQSAEMLRPDRYHGGKSNGGIHRVATPYPVPEPEHVGGINAEFRDFGSIGGDGNEVLRNCFRIAANSIE